MCLVVATGGRTGKTGGEFLRCEACGKKLSEAHFARPFRVNFELAKYRKGFFERIVASRRPTYDFWFAVLISHCGRQERDVCVFVSDDQFRGGRTL